MQMNPVMVSFYLSALFSFMTVASLAITYVPSPSKVGDILTVSLGAGVVLFASAGLLLLGMRRRGSRAWILESRLFRKGYTAFAVAATFLLFLLVVR
jgi:hypothetical protein